MKKVSGERTKADKGNTSLSETFSKELRIGISVETYSKLTRKALEKGVSAEVLVARVISELSKNDK